MASLDFPASPADGALFAAPNNVLYQWKATPGIWTAMQTRAAAPGDFMATLTPIPVTATETVLVFNTVATGNANGAYSTSTGRYTPPAGRYSISAEVAVFHASAATNYFLNIRKNGVLLCGVVDGGAGANFWANPIAQVVADANGTDYFDVTIQTGTGTSSNGNGRFMAFPIAPPLAPVALPTAPGDFHATLASFALTGTAATIVFTGVQVGNLGGYYSTSTGRFTPPAGRYYLFGGFAVNSSANSWANATLRKNGTALPGLATGSGSIIGTGYGGTDVAAIVDANGSDWFDLQGGMSSGTGAAINGWFGAFPLQPALIPYPQAITADFCATVANGPVTVPAATTVFTGIPVASGNTGGYYNSSNGRFTPPAGRYYVYAFLSAISTTVTNASIHIRKNGARFGMMQSSVPNTSYWTALSVDGTVDANGTDYFELTTGGSPNGYDAYYITFGAFPVSPVAPANIPRIVVSATAPPTPVLNDLWVDTT